MLHVRLLGDLELELDGVAIDPPVSRRARSLLGLLALDRRLHPRPLLAARFWPDVLDESARTSLRSALAALRRSLGPEADRYLVATRERAGLTDHVETDVAAFERLRRADRARGGLRAVARRSPLRSRRRLGARRSRRMAPEGRGRARRARDPGAERRGPARRSRPHPPDRRARPAQRGGSACAHVPARSDRGSRRGARRVQPVCRSAPRRAPDRAIADHESAGRRTTRLRCRGQVGSLEACGLDSRANLGGRDSDPPVYRSRRLDRAARRPW